jgi:hypothetical protein
VQYVPVEDNLDDRCSILYTNKEFSFKSPYKEFIVDPQEGNRLQP